MLEAMERIGMRVLLEVLQDEELACPQGILAPHGVSHLAVRSDLGKQNTGEPARTRYSS